MILRNSEIPDLTKYATKTLENDCFIDLKGNKLCLSYLLTVISEKFSRPMYFLIKIKSHALAFVSYANYEASGGHFVTNFW